MDRNGPGGTTTRWSFDRLAEEVATATRAVMAHGIEPGDRVADVGPELRRVDRGRPGCRRRRRRARPAQHPVQGGRGGLHPPGLRGPGCSSPSRGSSAPTIPALLDEAVAGGALPDLERGGRPARPTTRTATTGANRAAGVHGRLGRTFLAVADTCEADVAAGRTAAITADDLSDLIFTSGTTGHPKGAMTTHGQTLRTFATWSEVVGLRAGDRYLIVNPFFHTFGYKAGILACLMAGATMVPEPVFDVDVVLRADRRGAHLGAARSTDDLPVDPRPPDAGLFDLSTLRLVVTGAAVGAGRTGRVPVVTTSVSRRS